MSYCRMSNDSDVYIFKNIEGYYECCGCKLSKKRSFQCKTYKTIVLHLDRHKRLHHKVPDHAYRRLWKERCLIKHNQCVFDTQNIIRNDILILRDMMNNNGWDKDDRKDFQEQIKELKSVLEFLKQYTKLGGHNV